jgi:hypothetical protein
MELDQLSVREQSLVARPLLVSDKDAVTATHNEQWRLQPGKVVPEGPISGCLKGLDPGVLIDAFAYGRATPTAAEQATRDFSRHARSSGT